MALDADTGHAAILILDDEPQVVAALEDVLEDHFRIISLTSPQAALEMLESGETISAILCDQRMPEMTGDEFLARARDHTDATRVLITGYADLSGVIRAVNEGRIFGYLTKPWNAGQLITTTVQAVSSCERDRELCSEKLMFHDLMSSVPDGVFIQDASGRFVRINGAGQKMLGPGAPGDAIGRTPRDVVPVDLAEAWGDVGRGIRAGDAPDGALLHDVVMRDGETRSFSIRIAPRRGPDERISGFFGISRDITEARRAERMKDEFVSTVSHELKTPLTSIIGSLSLIRSGVLGELPPRVDEMLEICDRNGRRLLRLVQDILDLQAIKSGKLHFEEGPVDIPTLLAEAVAANEGIGRPEGKIIDLVCPVPAVRVSGDHGRLIQVLSNLISNALKFSPPDGRIRVRAVIREGMVRLSVADLAGGVPEAFQPKIFKAFSQADGSSARTHNGSGLGLHISRSIVEAHGGRLDYSTRAGVGSCFFLELPLLTTVGDPAT